MDFNNNSGNSNLTISIISVAFYSIGIIANILSFFICLRKELRKTPTFIFMAFIASTNTIKLLSLIVTTIKIEFNSNMNIMLLNSCLFIMFWKYQSSAYLNVNIMISF